MVVDLETGDVVHWVRIDGSVQELYDVVAIPGVTRPKALGFKTPEVRHQIWFDDYGQLSVWTGKSRG